MRWSRSLIPTLKEDPADAEAISHKLMVRAGLVRQLAAGIYVYLPLGQRVMDKIIGHHPGGDQRHRRTGDHHAGDPAGGALAAVGPLGHHRRRDVPAQGPEPARHVPGNDARRGHRLAGGPEIRSYRDLPQIWYQIQTKERDEARPKSGVLRTREFVMKDSYSLDRDARRSGRPVRGPPPGLLPDLRPLWREVLRRRERSRHDGRGGLARVHGAEPSRGGPRGHLRRSAGTPRTWNWPSRGAHAGVPRLAPWRRWPRPTLGPSPRCAPSSASNRRSPSSRWW